jgi:hypothetical protein
VVLARYTAVLLVLVLSVASARMLLCESWCTNATPAAAREVCHYQTAGEAPLTQLAKTHSCDHSDVVVTVTLTSSKVTFARVASSLSAPSDASNPASVRFVARSAHAPPGRTHNSRVGALANLRI